MKKPVVGYFVHNLDGYSGAAAQALLLAENINAKVIFFNNTNNVGKKIYPKNFEVLELPRGLLSQTIFILFHTLRKKISHFHFHGLFNSGMLAARILHINSVLKTTLIGDDDIVTLRRQRLWPIRKHLLGAITFNICLTRQIAHLNKEFFPEHKIKVIPNGVAIPSYTQTKEEMSFCFVGVICERKNTLASIKYFYKNYSHHPAAKLYIVGPNNFSGLSKEASHQHYEECEYYISSKGLLDKVIFVGALSKPDVIEIMQRCLAMLFFSEAEGMPNVVLEALSCNCVPITGAIQGTAYEIIDNNKNGFIVSDHEQHISIDSIRELVKAEAPRLKAQRAYDIKIISHRIEETYTTS